MIIQNNLHISISQIRKSLQSLRMKVVVFHSLKLHEAKGIKKNIIEQSRSNNKLNKMSFSFIDDKTLRCILNATTQSYEYGRKIHKLKSEEVMTSQHSYSSSCV